MQRHTGETPPELEQPEMPAELRHVMPLFLELAGARSYEQGVPGQIQPTQIAAWLALRGIRPTSRTLWFLRQLDSAWLKAMREAGQRG